MGEDRICVLLKCSFRHFHGAFLGLFHWQMYDVTGSAPSSSHAQSGPNERVIWVDGSPPWHAAELKHVARGRFPAYKVIYLTNLLNTVYCICRQSGGQSTSLGSLISSKSVQAQYTHPAAHSHVAATTQAKSHSLSRRIYTWYDPCFIDGVMVHFT